MGMLKDAATAGQEQVPAEQSVEQITEQPAEQPMNPAQQEGKAPLPEQFEKIKEQAITFMYDEKFDQMIKMFQQNGAEGFPRSVAVAINGAISKTKKVIPFDHKMAAVLGMDLFMIIIEDMATGTMDGQPVVPNLGMEHIQAALPATLKMYADSNPDVTDEVMQELLTEIKAKGGMQNGNV
jgi:hypothetical protein